MFQPVDRLERGGGVVFLRLSDHAAHHWVDHFGPRLEQRLDGGVALGHPWAVVEQTRHFEKRGEIESGDDGAQMFGAFDCRLIGFARLRIATEIRRSGNANAQLFRKGIDAVTRATRINIRCIKPGGGVEHRLRIVRRERKDRYAIERAAGRHHTTRRERALGRLQANDVVEPGRHAARACRIGAERKTHQPARHHRGRAGTRPARHIGGVEAVRYRAVGRARAVEPGGKLVEIGLAEKNGTGVDQALHRGGGVWRRVGEFRAGCGSRLARVVDVVLDREGDAVEREFAPVAARRGEALCERDQLRVDRRCVETQNPGCVVRHSRRGSGNVHHQGCRFKVACAILRQQVRDQQIHGLPGGRTNLYTCWCSANRMPSRTHTHGGT